MFNNYIKRLHVFATGTMKVLEYRNIISSVVERVTVVKNRTISKSKTVQLKHMKLARTHYCLSPEK